MAAERRKWLIVDEEGGEEAKSPAGWVQAYGTLSEIVVNAAGHLAPMDQPERLYQMITTFVRNENFLTE